MTAIALVNGSTYYAGASRPFFISQSTVSSYLRGKGLSNVVWHKRSEALPSNVTPRSDPNYDDDWDEWVSAEYNGQASSVSPPVSIPWLIVHLPSVAQQSTPTTTRPPASTAGVPSWVTSSAQAGYAAAQAAAQAAAAAASAGRPSGVSSTAAAPATSTPTPSAPRDGQTGNAGAAVLATGVLVVLGTLVAAILRRKRH